MDFNEILYIGSSHHSKTLFFYAILAAQASVRFFRVAMASVKRRLQAKNLLALRKKCLKLYSSSLAMLVPLLIH